MDCKICKLFSKFAFYEHLLVLINNAYITYPILCRKMTMAFPTQNNYQTYTQNTINPMSLKL